MNRHFIEIWEALKTIPIEEYLFVGFLTFIVYQLLFPFENRLRNQTTAAIYFILWGVRWIGRFQYHELVNFGQDLPFTKTFIPLCSFVYLLAVFFEQGEVWRSLRRALLASLVIACFSILVF